MKQYTKDPMLNISIALAALGAIQASTNLLTPLLQRYPTAFGLVMTGISVVTAVLTVRKTYLAQQPPDAHGDDGTSSNSE
jgi:hypothetical protein